MLYSRPKFYAYDFTGLVANITSDEERDFEMDRDVEASKVELVNNSVEVLDDRKCSQCQWRDNNKVVAGRKQYIDCNW